MKHFCVTRTLHYRRAEFKAHQFQFSKGFTIVEFVSVVAIVSILMAISAPTGLRSLNTHRLVSAQQTIYQGIQQAQLKARQTHAEWQFSIREVTDGSLEWTIHPASSIPDTSSWQSVGHSSVQMDLETTLQRAGLTRTVRFDQRGNVKSRLGRVTLSTERFRQTKRCVYVSTIVGATRQSKEQHRPYQGDFCY